MTCTLCHCPNSDIFFKDKNNTYLSCNSCGSIFKHPEVYLPEAKEKARYLQHNNDVNDVNYQYFVSPLVTKIAEDFDGSHHGLDFGAGPGPVALNMLKQKGFSNIALWDPFFYPQQEVLTVTYDFVYCIEVIEHFYNPYREFKKLYALLQPGGKLYCMTHLLPALDNFKDWYYKNDTTHVFFYSEQSFLWIKKEFGFSQVTFDNRCIVFTK